MFVDEAQKLWRTRRGNKEPPPELLAMEEHRYEGVDLYLISQDPSYIDSHIKGLVHKHWHCIPYGNSSSRVFEFTECQDNPQNMTKRAHAEFKVWKHPREYYACYESAKHHMDKPKIPWRHRLPKVMLWGACLLLVLAVCALVFDWSPKTAKAAGTAPVPVKGSSMFSGFGSLGGKRKALETPEAYLAFYQPRFPELPYSAPAYDDRKVQAEPQVFCVESGDGLDANGEWQRRSYTCLTEQGTSYVLPKVAAIRNARKGPAYNPFKSPASQTAMGEPAVRARGAPAGSEPAPSPVGVGEAGQLQAGYGSFRGEPVTVPPADGF